MGLGARVAPRRRLPAQPPALPTTPELQFSQSTLLRLLLLLLLLAVVAAVVEASAAVTVTAVVIVVVVLLAMPIGMLVVAEVPHQHLNNI